MINDNCHAIGSSYKNRKDYASKYADFVIHSYHAVKNITCGEGGAIFTNDTNLAEICRSIRVHGQGKDKYDNIINDNFVYFNVKKTDASRVYGLEFEHMLSPHNLNFLVNDKALIEEHIAGIPGDIFIKDLLPKCSELEKSQIAKEYVKFNERCMLRLLGDMRAYNYVVIPIHDFDQVIYKIRAIDFDQQCYEGKFSVYRPQFFKEFNINIMYFY